MIYIYILYLPFQVFLDVEKKRRKEQDFKSDDFESSTRRATYLSQARLH
jgi:hypothetical protein